LSYLGNERVIILRCHRFDPNNSIVDERYELFDIKHKLELQSDEPFVLAEQTQQVVDAIGFDVLMMIMMMCCN